MRISDWSSDVCSSDLADLALYAAKGSGRGRFRFYSSDLHQAAEDRRVLEEDLRDALARGQMELNYQPVVNAKTNRVNGVEAMIRWNPPEREHISHSTLVPHDEEAILIRTTAHRVTCRARHRCQDETTTQ